MTGPSSWLRRPRSTAALLLAVVLSTAVGVAHAELVRPIALAVSAAGDVVILHRHGGLYRADPSRDRLSRVRDGFGAWQPLDMTLVNEGGAEVVYVTQHWPVRSDRSLYRLARYDATTGERTSEWLANLPLTIGVAVRPEAPTTAYLAANVEGEIVSLDLTQRMATTDRVARLWRAGRLGALVLDPVERRLWVVDTGKSVVLSVGLDGTIGPQVRADLSLPVALSVDVERRRLFVLDNVDRRVLVVDLASDALRAETFADLHGVRDPLGLAVDGLGRVWVGDAGSGRLLSFDAEGRFLRWLRLALPDG